jgi:hypothetical protein
MDEITNFFKFSIDSLMAAKELNFLSEPSDILKALLNSKEEGTSIGIKANDFGLDPIITAVENIIFEEGQTLIVLKHYDQSGYILPSYKINLLNITAVYPFASPFKNPILSNLEKDKPPNTLAS